MPYYRRVNSCRVTSGPGSTAEHLRPMLEAWAHERGIELEPCTFNLWADRLVILPERYESLASFGHLAPVTRQLIPGFDPRLYLAVLNDKVEAWLFQWSAPGDIRNFVGTQPGVREKPTGLLELVAELDLWDALHVGEGDIVTMVFVPREERREVDGQRPSGRMVAWAWAIGVMVLWLGTKQAIDLADVGLSRAATVEFLSLVGVVVPITLTRLWRRASRARRS